MTASDLFIKNYPKYTNSAREAFVPYRICPLGAHVDHQKGIINGFAIDKGITLVFAPSGNGACRISSLNFSGEESFDTKSELIKDCSWGDYAKAAAWSLISSGYEIKNGFYGVLKGDLPVGGLSSSAAVIICYLKALCSVNGISLSKSEVISTAHKAEREFISLNCGTLDQSCEVLCKKDSLLYLDTLDGSYKNILRPENMPDFEIAVFFSGIERSLVSSKYNLRTDELKAAGYALKAYSGEDYGRMSETVLRDIPIETYQEFKALLPEPFRKRCEHYYSETERVKKGTLAFEKGNLSEYGRYIFESGHSSIYNYEAGSPELIKLHEILTETEGIYGGRFSGAGFKGCCMALIDPKYKENIREKVTSEYCKAFPELKEKFSVCFCKTADGCGGINND